MKYIHPDDPAILAFSASIAPESAPLETVCRNLFAWFEANIAYSRLNAPFSPLQRSDLDVLSMRSGTCGDYASLFVSVLTARSWNAAYAYVHRDCRGDEQDHICAAVQENGSCILIDPTQPYRKFHGFDCPHREYELLSPAEFEKKMTSEEEYWQSVADRHNRPDAAGLLYAPWLHSEPLADLPDRLENAFFLLILDAQLEPTLYVYHQRHTQEASALPVMATIGRAGTFWQFSVHPRSTLWDNAQWSQPYAADAIPPEQRTDAQQALQSLLPPFKDRVNEILRRADLPALD